MRNAATILGMIGGIFALIIGVISFSYTEAVDRWQEIGEVFWVPENPAVLRAVSVIAPMLAIVGAGMARYRALWGGILLLVSAAAIYTTFANFIAIFPAAMCGLAGLLAITAGRPDKETSHF